MYSNEWIKALRVGDEVIVCYRFHETLKKVTAVNKVTIKVGDTLFNKSDGFERGGDMWNKAMLKEATPEKIDILRLAIAKTKLILRIDQIGQDLRNKIGNSLSMEAINEINECLDKFFK